MSEKPYERKSRTEGAKADHLSSPSRKFEETWARLIETASSRFMEGLGSKAAGLYSRAARFIPRNPEVWETMAHIYMRQGRKADAVATLYKGHGFYAHGPESARAVAMLRRAFEIEPWNFRVTLSLALLVKNQDPAEALRLLEGLSARAEGRDLRKVRSAMFCAEPSFTMAWRWIKTAWPNGLGPV